MGQVRQGGGGGGGGEEEKKRGFLSIEFARVYSHAARTAIQLVVRVQRSFKKQQSVYPWG